MTENIEALGGTSEALTETQGTEPLENHENGSEAPPSPSEDMFPREVVEKLRKENAKYRERAKRADDLAKRLHESLVRETGRLADPSDLPYDEAHLDDPEALASAIEELLKVKPHLASRRPVGDIGQGARGVETAPSLMSFIRPRA